MRVPRPVVLLVVLALALTACGPPDPPSSVLLVTLDTTRRDRLSVYGFPRPTSPNLEKLAARGTLFESAWAQSPETGPSLASVLTGRRQSATGVRGNGERLDQRLPTLATAAKASGLRTAAFVSTVLLRDDVCAFDRGFDVYDDEMTDPCFGHDKAQRIAAKTIDRALAWLDEVEGPYFLWVHLYDPHGPYTPPAPMESLDATRSILNSRIVEQSWIPRYQRVGESLDAADYCDRYDREVAYMDRELGRLLDVIDYRTTTVAVHADHGEALGDEDYWFRHGNLLHNAVLKIPMILAGRNVHVGGRQAHHFRNLDLAPTLISLARWPQGLGRFDGEDWGAHHLTPQGGSNRRISEARKREIVKDDTGIDTRWKLRYHRKELDFVWWPATDERELARPVDPRYVDEAVEELREWLSAPPGAASATPDTGSPTDLPDALKGLGYK